jgi:hypothetical protein
MFPSKNPQAALLPGYWARPHKASLRSPSTSRLKLWRTSSTDSGELPLKDPGMRPNAIVDVIPPDAIPNPSSSSRSADEAQRS